MNIKLSNIGKKFGKVWLFRNLDYAFETGKKYAITGYNGSGKTTLLKIIAAAAPSNEGKVEYTHQGKAITGDAIYQYITWTGPYTGLPNEMTLTEVYHFYNKFKPIQLTLKEFIARIKLESAKNKSIQNFSSGMKQKLQIALALYSESSLILLDEPSANFDQHNTAWLEEEIATISSEKTVIISSNQALEIALCNEVVSIEKWK